MASDVALRPMLARPGSLPRDGGRWGFEVKWDGVRALAHVRDGGVELRARTGRDISARYPELASLPGPDAILDGEIVAFDERGRPSFERLQTRMHLASAAAVRVRAAECPVTFVAFDLLMVAGRPLLAEPYAARRALLAELALEGPWQAPAHRVGEGEALLDATRELGLEGVVAKRLDSPYEPGRRTSSWVKVKHSQRARLAVGGWLPGEGGRSGRLGSLLVGERGAEGLRYAGRVGSGLTEAMLARLDGLLGPLRRPESPFAGRQPPRASVFVEPVLEVDVEFADWTSSRTLRAPRFKGLAPATSQPMEDFHEQMG
jgi:bifunctional non-homologous end joining protein LigD